jgi:hypothetical protein
VKNTDTREDYSVLAYAFFHTFLSASVINPSLTISCDNNASSKPRYAALRPLGGAWNSTCLQLLV